MAQAIRNKDVKKNCVDVEKVILECLQEPERDKNGKDREPVKIKRLRNEISKSKLENNSVYNMEFLDINRVKQNLVFKNYAVYNM